MILKIQLFYIFDLFYLDSSFSKIKKNLISLKKIEKFDVTLMTMN